MVKGKYILISPFYIMDVILTQNCFQPSHPDMRAGFVFQKFDGVALVGGQVQWCKTISAGMTVEIYLSQRIVSKIGKRLQDGNLRLETYQSAGGEQPHHPSQFFF